MGLSNLDVGRRSKSTPSYQTDEPLTLHSILQHIISRSNEHHGRQRPRHSWTREQLSDANFLKVPASMWKNIYDPMRTEWVEAAKESLTATLAAGALISTPNVGLCKVHKWFWDKSIETTCRKDTYRYRVIEQATDTTILPADEWYDPVEDDESKIKILFVGLPFKEHTILLLRRICPDVNMPPMQSADHWREYLAPSIRQGYGQIKKSTTYGWAPPVNKRNKKGGRRRKAQLPTPEASSRSNKGKEVVKDCVVKEKEDDDDDEL